MRRLFVASAAGIVCLGLLLAASPGLASASSSGDSAALLRLSSAMRGLGKVFGISPQGNSSGIPTVVTLSEELDHPIDIVNIFVGWGEGLPVASMREITEEGAVPELTWEPWNFTEGVDQPYVSDAVIASGAYDTYIRQFAVAAEEWGSPFLLRYAHEMNGNWYPWGASVNGNTPATYTADWQHVHNIFTAEGASNALWVWCPNAGGPTPVAQVFPGARYVNIIGMDGYNWGNASGGWQTPSQIFSGLFQTVRSLDLGAPVLINETGSGEQGGSKATWLTELFSYVKSQQDMMGVVYSNFGTNWPLDTSASALAAAKQALQTY
jgi:hypothetical protein